MLHHILSYLAAFALGMGVYVLFMVTLVIGLHTMGKAFRRGSKPMPEANVKTNRNRIEL